MLSEIETDGAMERIPTACWGYKLEEVTWTVLSMIPERMASG
jgi:hypothetical protein